MKKTLLLMVAMAVIIASCKKDNDDPVDQDAVRVASEATYYNNGNLRSLNIYSYHQDGMIKSELRMHSKDSLVADTATFSKNCTNYSKTDNNFIMMISYSINNGIASLKDTSLIKLNDEGLYSGYNTTYQKNEDSTLFRMMKYYYKDGYKTATYFISYYNDSLEDPNVKRQTKVYTIENGNCVKVSTDGTTTSTYEYYTDKVNTLNYGKSFYGKISKNPVSMTDYYNQYYEYFEGKINKVTYEQIKNSEKSTVSDSTIDLPISISMPHTTYFTYEDL